MKTLRNSGDARITNLAPDRKLGRYALLLGTLLMVMALATGCSMIEDFDTATTVPPQDTTTSTLSSGTSTTVAETTTTSKVTETTTATDTAKTTTTSKAADTTTTSVETSTTLAAVGTTTTLEAPTTTTTMPPTVASPDELDSESDVLYEISDWSEGISGWAAAGQWKTTGGMLVTDGSSDSFAVAPVDLTGYPDYAVECEAQVIDPADETLVLLMARMINGTAYYGGFDGSQSRMAIGYGTSELAHADFVIDDTWHTYRLEVRGNTMTLFLEQAEVARTMDNRTLEPGTVGIYCGSGQINVRSFRVLAL